MFREQSASQLCASVRLLYKHTWSHCRKFASYSIINTSWIVHGMKSEHTATSWEEMVNLYFCVRCDAFKLCTKIFSFSVPPPASKFHLEEKRKEFWLRPGDVNEINTSCSWNVADHSCSSYNKKMMYQFCCMCLHNNYRLNSCCNISFQLRTGMKKGKKQGSNERTQEGCQTFAKTPSRCIVVFWCSFICTKF